MNNMFIPNITAEGLAREISRKVLLIGNPGLKGAKNYAPQVYDVLEQYKAFFCSPVGGCFDKGDILDIKGCTSRGNEETVLTFKLREIDEADYSIIVFVGHGRDNNRTDEIQLSLGSFWPVSSFCASKNPELRRTIIIDACRVETDFQTPMILNESFDYRAQGNFNPTECHNYYNYLIKNTKPHIDLIYSTQKGCPAYLTNKGTFFGDTLFNQISKQIQIWNIEAINGNAASSDVISYEKEVDLLKTIMASGNQIPEYTALYGYGSFPLMCCKF